MIKIYIPMADGEALMPEVLEGILRQKVDCVPIVITSPRDPDSHYRGNLLNWIAALQIRDKDYPFIGMDSDVVMHNRHTIKELLKVTDIDFVAMASQPRHYQTTQDKLNIAHALFYVKNPEQALHHFQVASQYDDTECCWCDYINYAILKTNKVYRLYKQPGVMECDRITIREGKEEIKRGMTHGTDDVQYPCTACGPSGIGVNAAIGSNITT